MHGTPICTKGCPFQCPINADSGHRRLTGLDLRNPLESGFRSSKCSPPTSWAGSLLWLLRRAAGNPRAASAALRNQTVSDFLLRVRDPAAAPDWLLGASPLLCRGRNRGARLLCAQWWARSCDRSDAGRLARPMGRGDGVLRGHASGHQQGLDYTMAHAARSYGHRADKTSHTMSMSMIDPDCPHRSVTIESVKYCSLKLRYLLNR